ncbi:hypothetical protein EDD53_0223 [Pacificibacter maritimus]|uniref:Lipoprotein n=1 Tax=Pacificibacter maritimus TaxID=762213 RepID=A0A3N4VBA6_9RHOB|nr:hypothetical protein [Pacificibacter maritimus]RPE71110.1 hypothetical protein EDD53_0223 [Pacificibacter maritimus]
MSIAKLGAITAVSVTILAGCQTSDPAYQEQKSQQRAATAASAAQTISQEFAPLLPICYTTLAQGTPVSAEKMASLGYKKALVGYKKPRGTTTMDRINLSNTTFNATGKTCTIGLGNFFGVQEAGAYVRKSLVANGYSAGTKSKKGFAFTKGDSTLYLNGFSYQTTTSVSLSR